MKTMKTLRSQSGFSLIELMVVVAIIGILATMSVGAVSKQIAKSRQAEGKSNLASLFTSMKAFQAEYGVYTNDFRAIGAGFEGNMRYETGFAAIFAPPAAPAYTGGASGQFATGTFCGGGTCTVIATNATAPTAATGATTGTTFTASANAWIFNTALNDRWTIDQNKLVTNTVPGIN